MSLSWDTRTPEVDEYLALRTAAGLSRFSKDAARRGLAGTWQAACVRDDGSLVGMGRIVGDGGCFFQIVDVAVSPDFQRQGLGRDIMRRLMDTLRQRAPVRAFVSLLADPPGMRLYEACGFRASAPGSVGMFWRVGGSPQI